MPIYEYRCQACEEKFSAQRAMKDADAPIHCPECGSDATQRALSTFFASSNSGPLKGAGSSSSACGSCSASSCATCGGH